MSIFKTRKAATCDCTRGYCHRPHHPHGPCIQCGDVISERRLVVTKRLSRRLEMVCVSCWLSPTFSANQARLSEKRTKQAWEHVSDPVETQSIRPEQMPEQNPGASRAAIRAFYLSTASVAVVPDVAAVTLSNSIAALGLHQEIYAETRGTETVLRKVS